MILPGSGESKSVLNHLSFTILKPLDSKRGMAKIDKCSIVVWWGQG